MNKRLHANLVQASSTSKVWSKPAEKIEEVKRSDGNREPGSCSNYRSCRPILMRDWRCLLTFLLNFVPSCTVQHIHNNIRTFSSHCLINSATNVPPFYILLYGLKFQNLITMFKSYSTVNYSTAFPNLHPSTLYKIVQALTEIEL